MHIYIYIFLTPKHNLTKSAAVTRILQIYNIISTMPTLILGSYPHIIHILHFSLQKGEENDASLFQPTFSNLTKGLSD